MPSPRILLVDDEPSIRLTLGANLELADFEVVEADSAARALELLAEQHFDLVLSDVLMPGMNGVELFQQIKRTHPDVPVILMTAYALDELKKQAVESGVYAVLPKTCDVERLSEFLTRASRRPRVLVLDESPAGDASAAQALQRAGLRVQVANSMDSARSSIQRKEVDIGVLSVNASPEKVQAIVQQMLGDAPALDLVVIAGQIPDEVMARLACSGVRSLLSGAQADAQLLEVVAKLRAQSVVG